MTIAVWGRPDQICTGLVTGKHGRVQGARSASEVAAIAAACSLPALMRSTDAVQAGCRAVAGGDAARIASRHQIQRCA
jgi:hypothetical protein